MICFTESLSMCLQIQTVLKVRIIYLHSTGAVYNLAVSFITYHEDTLSSIYPECVSAGEGLFGINRVLTGGDTKLDLVY